MASTSLFSSIFVMIALLMMNIHLSSSEFNNSDFLQAEKVNLSLYYESVPGCQQFIVDKLSTLLYDQPLISIVNLHLMPCGNARTQAATNNVTCQVSTSFNFKYSFSDLVFKLRDKKMSLMDE